MIELRRDQINWYSAKFAHINLKNKIYTNENGNKSAKLLMERNIFLDRPMGTMIRDFELNENDFRGSRFKNPICELK